MNGTQRKAILDIGLAVAGLVAEADQPRARVFPPLQRLLAGVYKLIGAVAAKGGFELDSPGGIDVRVVFLMYDDDDDDDDKLASTTAFRSERPASCSGPVVELRTLADSARSWDLICHLESQAGMKLAKLFLRFLVSEPGTYALPSGESSITSERFFVGIAEQEFQRHYSVAVGGTFDHLHIGHKLLLTATALALDLGPDGLLAQQERLITVGVTGDELLVRKKYAEYLESWEARCQSAASFLTSIIDFMPPRPLGSAPPAVERKSGPGANETYMKMEIASGVALKLVELSDPCGPTITDQSISALVVSAETRTGGQVVNEQRAKKGWAPLEIFEVNVLDSGEAALAASAAADTGGFESKISSTEIRRRRMEQA